MNFDGDVPARLKRRVLSDKELEVMRNSIPSTRHGSSHMFRNLRDKGERAKVGKGEGKREKKHRL